MADNLESYFKKHLSDDQPAMDNWNVPSDEVWNNVLPVIQKKRGLFIPWKYLYLIGALVVIGLAIIFWPTGINETAPENKSLTVIDQIHQEIQTSNTLVESKSIESSETFKKNSNNSSEGKTLISNKIDQTAENIATKSVNAISVNERNAAASQATKSFQIDYENNLSAESASTNTASASVISENNPAVLKDGNSTKKSAETLLNLIQADHIEDKMSTENNGLVFSDMHSFGSLQEDAHIEKMPVKSFDNFITVAHPSPLKKEITMVPLTVDKQRNKPVPIDNKGKFGIIASFIPTFTSTYVKGNLSSGQLETTNMLLYSNNWGLEIRYYLSNRFTLVAGIGQSEVRSWSKSIVDFGYDASTEHIMDTGEKENTSAVPMPTPFGEIGTEITYRFPGEENIPDGEPMQSELETHQEVRYLSIPLGVEFNIIRFSQFSWFAETGIRYNRALKDAASFTSRILHEGHDMVVVGEKMMGHPTFTNNYLDIYLGTGINYQISKSFQISGSARYFNSITKVNEQDNVSTHVRGFNIKLGITYIF